MYAHQWRVAGRAALHRIDTRDRRKKPPAMRRNAGPASPHHTHVGMNSTLLKYEVLSSLVGHAERHIQGKALY